MRVFAKSSFQLGTLKIGRSEFTNRLKEEKRIRDVIPFPRTPGNAEFWHHAEVA